MKKSPGEITELLQRWAAGEEEAFSHLERIIRKKMNLLAHNRLDIERRASDLETKELVNHTIISLLQSPRSKWSNREHFYRSIARIMRNFLIDLARQRKSQRHGSDFVHSGTPDQVAGKFLEPESFLTIDAVLKRLALRDPLLVQVVELRFFAGFSTEEVSTILDISLATVTRKWKFAKSMLAKELKHK